VRNARAASRPKVTDCMPETSHEAHPSDAVFEGCRARAVRPGVGTLPRKSSSIAACGRPTQAHTQEPRVRSSELGAPRCSCE
jgi:hypothetical protein